MYALLETMNCLFHGFVQHPVIISRICILAILIYIFPYFILCIKMRMLAWRRHSHDSFLAQINQMSQNHQKFGHNNSNETNPRRLILQVNSIIDSI